MSKPKICFFNTNKSWGGGEKWHFEYSEALCADGYPTVVMAQPDSELARRISEKGKQKLILVKVSNLSFLNPRKVKEFQRLFISENLDTIIMNLPADLKVAGLAAKKAGILNRIYRRGSAIPIRNTFINRYLFKQVVTRVIVNSEKTGQTILQNNPNLIERNKIHIVYNGIDLQEYDKDQTKLFQREQDDFIIGNLGRLSEQKCQDLLLKVASILKSKNLHFKLLIGGTGEREAELKAMTANLKLEKYVEFLGFVQSSRSFMNAIDLFVLTSKWEGFGYVLVEAAAAEVPVIAFNISSNPEVLIDGVTGELINPFNIEQMAAEIEKLANNRIKRIAMGRAGRAMVEEKFQFQTSFEKLKKLLTEKN